MRAPGQVRTLPLRAARKAWRAARTAVALAAAPSWAEIEPAEVRNSRSAPPAPRGVPIRIVTWNVQFCASRAPFFWYDGGDVVSVSEPTVRSTATAIAAALRHLDADVVLLQEVDRGARRTAFLDQLALLEGELRPAARANTSYWRARYIPTPSHEPIGRASMDLVVLSRYRIASARRLRLPPLRESWLRRRLNVQRAILDVRVALDDGGELAVLDTHLSAFSFGDGTLGRQLAQVRDSAAAVDEAGVPIVVAGDFNALPPGDDPTRLGDHAPWYPEGGRAIEPLLARFASVVPPGELLSPRWNTYLRPGAVEPDRVLDYGFTAGLEVSDVRVVPSDLSDHRPLAFSVRVP